MSERTDDNEYESLQKEFGEQAPAATPPAPEPAASAPATPSGAPPPAEQQQPPADKPPLDYEELRKRYDNMRDALHEQRIVDRETKQRLRNMEEVFAQVLGERKGTAPKPPPDPQTDPLGHYDYRLEEQSKQLKELREQSESLTQEQRTKAEFDTFIRGAVAEEVEFAGRTPDYYQAAQHLENARRHELAVIYPDNDLTYAAARENGYPTIQAFREAILNQDRIAVANQARAQGVNAGEYYYRLAQARGYQRQAPMQRDQVMDKLFEPGKPNGQAGHVTQPTKFDRMQKGMAASGTLSSGAGGAPNEAPDDDTIEQLAQMYLDDPKEADKMFAKLKKAGKLG